MKIYEINNVEIYCNEFEDGDILVDPKKLCSKSCDEIAEILVWIDAHREELECLTTIDRLPERWMQFLSTEHLSAMSKSELVSAQERWDAEQEVDSRRAREERITIRKEWLKTDAGKLHIARQRFNGIRNTVYAQLVHRDGEKCNYCGDISDLGVDHINPLIDGGGNDLDNLQILCRSCNSKKGTK